MKTSRLIRDKVHLRPLPADCAPYRTRVTGNESEHNMALVLKCYEEIGEVHKAMDDPAEYADVLTALFQLARNNGVTREAIFDAFTRKRDADGVFETGVIMVRE